MKTRLTERALLFNVVYSANPDHSSGVNRNQPNQLFPFGEKRPSTFPLLPSAPHEQGKRSPKLPRGESPAPLFPSQRSPRQNKGNSSRGILPTAFPLHLHSPSPGEMLPKTPNGDTNRPSVRMSFANEIYHFYFQRAIFQKI